MSTTVTFPHKPYISGIQRIDFGEPGLTLEEVPVHEEYNETLGFSRLYTDKGELLVLISSGFGSSWSADCYAKKDLTRHLLMDARIVRFFYDTYIKPLVGKQRPCHGCGLVCSCRVDEAPMQQFLEELGFPDVYLGCLKNLTIETVPPNTKFRVTEYDGSESLIFYSEASWENS